MAYVYVVRMTKRCGKNTFQMSRLTVRAKKRTNSVFVKKQNTQFLQLRTPEATQSGHRIVWFRPVIRIVAGPPQRIYSKIIAGILIHKHSFPGNDSHETPRDKNRIIIIRDSCNVRRRYPIFYIVCEAK